jgi:hypothetical protein
MVASIRAISHRGKTASSALVALGCQRWVLPATRSASAALLFLVLAGSVLAPTSAGASNVKFVGNAGYTYAGNTAVLTADEIRNFDSSGASGPLHLELWAVTTPFDGGPMTGYKVAEYALGQLVAGLSYSNVSSGAVPFTPPPAGAWTFTIVVTEYTSGAPVDDGCLSISSAKSDGYTYTACMHASGYVRH